MGLLGRWAIFFFLLLFFFWLLHSCVAPCAFSFFRMLLGPLFLPSTELFLPRDHPTQLFGSYFEKFTHLLRGALVEEFPLQFQPYCCSQNVCWSIFWLMLHTSHIVPGQYVFSTFSILCSSVICGTGVATGFKNFSGRLS